MTCALEPSPHCSVMPREVLSKLLTRNEGPFKVIDGTLGFGGHSENFLRANPDLTLMGIDRDTDALAYSEKRLEFAKDRVCFAHGCYSDMARYAQQNAFESVDAVLLDIGVSSAQIDRAERGFSIRKSGPLDMRMNRADTQTAADIVNQASENELIRIFKEFGEIHSARKLAGMILDYRKKEKITRTEQLIAICRALCGKEDSGAMPLITLCFQALRIAVNDELGELERALPVAVSLLKPGGRVGVITFHSLEDRIVKQYFARESTQCLCPPKLPICCCGHKASLKLESRKPILATETECRENHRANCAKFRVAEKL